MADYTSQFSGSEIDARLAKVPQLESAVDGKQATLVSGTNIKTVNGSSILGSGNLQIQTGETDVVKYTAQTLTTEQQEQARTNIGGASAASVTAESARALAAEQDIMDAIDGTNVETVTVLPTASASTVGKIYYVGPDNNGEYARYRGIESGSSYSFLSIGTTEMDLTDYATTAQVSQLEHKVDDLMPTVFEDGFYIIDSERNIGFYVDENGISALIMSVLSTLFTTTTEDGFYIIDSDRNIGFMVNTSGAHSANLVEY